MIETLGEQGRATEPEAESRLTAMRSGRHSEAGKEVIHAKRGPPSPVPRLPKCVTGWNLGTWTEAREEGKVSAGIAVFRTAAGRQANEPDEIKGRLTRIAGIQQEAGARAGSKLGALKDRLDTVGRAIPKLCRIAPGFRWRQGAASGRSRGGSASRPATGPDRSR